MEIWCTSSSSPSSFFYIIYLSSEAINICDTLFLSIHIYLAVEGTCRSFIHNTSDAFRTVTVKNGRIDTYIYIIIDCASTALHIKLDSDPN